MTWGSRGPWLVSAGLHLLMGAVGVLILFREPTPAPPVVRMRLTSPVGSVAAEPKRSSWVPPSTKGAGAGEPALPGWRGIAPPPGSVPIPVSVPVSLDDLLGPAPAPSTDTKETSASEVGWTGPGGLGYSPPPLPPPGLVPPQGARWDLTLSVPGGGGFARSFVGLSSGHGELDRWLEEYLRTVSFPSSPDGRDFEVRWVLRLESGRPQ